MRKVSWCLCACLLILLPEPALADAGLPMLVITWPMMLLALAPVIVIEALVFHRRGFPFKASLISNAAANLVSTLVGIPLTWALLVFVEMAAVPLLVPVVDSQAGKLGPAVVQSLLVALYSPWLAPFDDSTLRWAMPVAILILLAPFFWVSYRVERRVIRMIKPDWPAGLTNSASFAANVYSYSPLALYPIYLLTLSSADQVNAIFFRPIMAIGVKIVSHLHFWP
jgi:hypothetical protein